MGKRRMGRRALDTGDLGRGGLGRRGMSPSGLGRNGMNRRAMAKRVLSQKVLARRGMSRRAFSSWEAMVFILLSAALLATLAGFSIQEFRTANRVYGTIQAGRLLDTLEFRTLPHGSERETVLTVPRGLQRLKVVKEGSSWKLTVEFNREEISREFQVKPVFDPANLLEVPGRHRVLVLKERDSVLIRKI